MAKCLASTLVLSSPQFSRSLATNSGCYDARCTTEGTVQVAVNNQWQACPPEGGLLLQWDGYDGDVECPVAAQVGVERSLHRILCEIGTGSLSTGAHSLKRANYREALPS